MLKYKIDWTPSLDLAMCCRFCSYFFLTLYQFLYIRVFVFNDFKSEENNCICLKIFVSTPNNFALVSYWIQVHVMFRNLLKKIVKFVIHFCVPLGLYFRAESTASSISKINDVSVSAGRIHRFEVINQTALEACVL